MNMSFRPAGSLNRMLRRWGCLTLLLPLFPSAEVQARQSTPFAGSLLPHAPRRQPPGQEEEELKPSRPGVANPAEIQKAGALQVEFGYDGLFRSDEFRAQHAAPLTLRFAATNRLLLELSLDAVKSETDEATRQRETGVGDTRLDWGARFGLNPAAPRFGLFGGVTFGVGGYKKP